MQSRVALITGATRGIGRAIARRLAHEPGIKLALLSRNKQEVDTLASELSAKTGAQCIGVSADVGQSEDVTAAVGDVVNGFGDPVHTLINCAGISKDGLLLTLQDSVLDEVIRTNLYGSMYTSRAVLKGMIRKKTGRIINIGSVVGITGNKGQVAYSASKAGLVGLTRSLAKEVAGRGITVNVIMPGFIETDMTDDLPGSTKEDILSRIPIGRFGKPEEVASLVSFLASPESAYITGQSLSIDGGMSMQ